MPAFAPSTAAPTHPGRFRPSDQVAGRALSTVGVPFGAPNLLAAYPRARIGVEAAYGADLTADPATWVWYDITGDVRQADRQMVSIVPMGRSDETSTAQPAGCAFQLDNTSGDYTAYSAASRWYPNVRANTPIRVTVNLTGVAEDSSVRFQGYANGWEPSWDTTGNLAVVTVSASGILRRLQQGSSPLESAMFRSIVAANPVRYWSLEDLSGSTTVASGLPSGSAMNTAGTINYASDSGLAGSQPSLVFTADSSLSSPIPTTPFASQWQIDWFAHVPAAFATDTVVMRVWTAGGTVAYWEFIMGTTGVPSQRVVGYDPNGGVLVDSGLFASPGFLTADWSHLRLMAKDAGGGNVQWALVEFPISGAGGSIGGTFAGTPGAPYFLHIPAQANLNGVAYAHIAAYNAYDFSATDRSARGWAPDDVLGGTLAKPEYAHERVTRLCAENGIPVTVIGTSDKVMGRQGVDTLLTLLRECERADGGVLCDGLGPGLTFVCDSSRYNAPATLTADVTVRDVGVPVQPKDNDQRRRNLVKITRKDGTTATFEDKTGPMGTDAIGTYDHGETLNLAYDAALVQHAAWKVHLGTVEGFRYPSLTLDLAARPAPAEAWLSCTVSSRIDLTNLSTAATQHPAGDVRLLLEGWGELLSPFVWVVRTNTSQYDPYEVGAYDPGGITVRTPRYDAEGATLSGAHDAAVTTLSLAIAGNNVFAHDDGDYVITVAGEDMLVTAVGAASGSWPGGFTQTLTVTRAYNGVTKAHASGEEVHVKYPARYAL